MKCMKLKKEHIVMLSFIGLSIVIPLKNYASTSTNSQEMEIFHQSGKASSDPAPIVTYDEPNSSAQILTMQEFPSNTFAITMPREIQEEQEREQNLKDLTEKIRQMYISAGATSILAGLTLYYACNTTPSEWLSGTMGSFCTNTFLTAMATNFLRNDKNSMQRRLSIERR